MKRKIIELIKLFVYLVACVLFEVGAIGYVIDINNKYSVWMYLFCATSFLLGISIEIVIYFCYPVIEEIT